MMPVSLLLAKLQLYLNNIKNGEGNRWFTADGIDLIGVVTDLTTEIEKLNDLASFLICLELKIAGSRIKQIISDALHQDGTPVIFEVYESEGVIEQVPIKHPPLEFLAQLGLL